MNKTQEEKIIRETELETLGTFQSEIPSIYFSDKDEASYEQYVNRHKYVYRDCFKFPPQMFHDVDLIDFGAGTGENTIFLANWGARCTLVEMNRKAQDISRKVFEDYAIEPSAHHFIESSIFDYEPLERKLYDIVHCRGVLSHTAAKELAFSKISRFVKPGGYLIYGDPNKAGGFQNMLQRFVIYKFASTPEEIVETAEYLFHEDISRSERAIPRTRRAIIFDRWVIQSQDDPSVGEVVKWVMDAGLRIYSCYPPVLYPILGDSIHHTPRFNEYTLNNLFSVAELSWMMHTNEDQNFAAIENGRFRELNSALTRLSEEIANFSKSSNLDNQIFSELVDDTETSIEKLVPLELLKDKFKKFIEESKKLISVVEKNDITLVRRFIEETEHLFRGACGVRHMDLIAYRPEE